MEDKNENNEKIQSLREMIYTAEKTLQGAKAMLLQLEGKKKVGRKKKMSEEEKDGSIENLYLTGPAAMVCAGEILDEAILKLVKRQEEKT